MTGALASLQTWYDAQCNGEWEHRYGVTVETLDNPGWRVTIDLTGTALAAKPFDAIEDLSSASEWLHCSVQESQFRGAGGPHQLEAILRVFLDWARDG